MNTAAVFRRNIEADARGHVAPRARAGRARKLAGAAVLQIVPALEDDAIGHAAMDIAVALLEAGARTIVAGENGPLVGELRALGGEFLPMRRETFNPMLLRSNASFLHDYVLRERIDIVHAHSAGAAWSALAAVRSLPVWLVTSCPDKVTADNWFRRTYHGVLARGDRIVAPSVFASLAMLDRYPAATDRITVVPRSIDTALFSPAAVTEGRLASMRRSWGLLPGQRAVLVMGPFHGDHGQTTALDALRLLAGRGARDVILMFAGDDRANPRTVRALQKHAAQHGIDTLIRFTGARLDLPAALAAADVVIVPALAAPPSGIAAVQAQAMGRPTIVSAAGPLPEAVLSPPRMPDDLRTGWVVRPGNAGELAAALSSALVLDRTSYEALGARARQFAEFMFSPRSVAEAIGNVYTSLLARDD